MMLLATLALTMTTSPPTLVYGDVVHTVSGASITPGLRAHSGR